MRNRRTPAAAEAGTAQRLRTPRPISPTLSLTETIGEQTYEWWIEAQPEGPDALRFATTWKVLRAGRLVRELRDGYLWHTLDTDRLALESGLRAERITDAGDDAIPELAVLTR